MSRFHQIVLKHYPLRRIEGDGPFALISECDSTQPILLFDLPSVRASTIALWMHGGCGAERCSGQHFQKTIRLQAPVPPVREQFCWERD